MRKHKSIDWVKQPRDDWVKQPRDLGTSPRKHPLLSGFFLQLSFIIGPIFAWFFLIISRLSSEYEPVKSVDDTRNNFSDLMSKTPDELQALGVSFDAASGWLLPAFLAVVLACYAVVVAGGLAKVGTPLRNFRPALTYATALIGAFVWFWMAVLVLESAHKKIEPTNLWAPLALSLIIIFLAAGFIGFDNDPPSIRSGLLRKALAEHNKAVEKTARIHPNLSSYWTRHPNAWVVLVSMCISVGTSIAFSLFMSITGVGFETGTNFFQLFYFWFVFGFFFIGLEALALWYFVDAALRIRLGMIGSRSAYWWKVGTVLAVYVLLILVTPGDAIRIQYTVFSVSSLGLVLFFILFPLSRQNRQVRNLIRANKAKKLLIDAQEKLSREQKALKLDEEFQAQEQKNAINDLQGQVEQANQEARDNATVSTEALEHLVVAARLLSGAAEYHESILSEVRTIAAALQKTDDTSFKRSNIYNFRDKTMRFFTWCRRPRS